MNTKCLGQYQVLSEFHDMKKFKFPQLCGKSIFGDDINTYFGSGTQ